MKKAMTIIVISLLCVSTLSTLTPKVMGWASSLPSALHEEMARDALQETGWSDLEIADIATMAFGGRSIEEDWPLEYWKDYYHRVQLYQDILHIYHGESCSCDDQGDYGAAEDGAYQYIQWARSNYTIGNEVEAKKCLGRAIHFIQDSVCPPHVFPFKEGFLSGPAFDFEVWTAEDPMVYQAFWSGRVRTADTQPIESAADLRSELRIAAAEVWTRFSSLSSGFGYLRQDGELIGDCSGEFFADHDWNMPINDIGWCMEKAASLVKGAARYVRGSVPPEVVCVPFHGKWLGVPHDAWIGKEIVLKGTAHDLDGDGTLTAYKWDFGDGYSTDWIAGVNPYVIEAKHTYTGTMADGTPYEAGKYFTAWLYVRDVDGHVGQDSYFIAILDKTLDVEVNVAIDDGLWWLHKQAYRYTSGGIDYARWYSSGYYASATAESVLAFEIQGHQPIGDAEENPYVETVQRGLNYVFSQTRVVGISAWGPGTSSPYGDPDTNANDKGIGISSSQEVYELGMVMMAIAASGDPDLTANTGPIGVAGRTYKDILTDMVDLCAWGQNDYGGARGGWRYAWNYGSSDNSVSQWPMMALEAAETNWGIVVADFVKTELDTYWLTYSQRADGGFGYTGPDTANIARTGTGIIGLNYVGLLVDNPRIAKAVNWLGTHWSEFGNYYGMYAVMKAMRTAHPEITMVGAHDWYSEYSRYLVDHQMADDGWPDYYGRVLATDWAILIMTPTVTQPGPVADAGPDVNNFPPTIPLEFDVSGSHHGDPTKSIELYEWDFESDGTWDYSGTDLEVEHAYPAYYTDGSIDWDATAKDYTATLRVTDNSDPPLQSADTCVIHITAPPWKPVADSDGPYEGYEGVSIQLDGSKSYDPESKMYTEEHPWYETISTYEWDLDNDGQFDDSTEISPSYTWTTKGTYSVGLKVTDSQPSGSGGTVGPLDVDTKYTTVVIKVTSPIVDIAEETISANRQSADGNGDGSPDYGWTTGYDISFTSQTLHIEIDIQLVGDDPGGILRQTWHDGIENIWSNAYDIVDGPYTYQIEVGVDWVTSNPHHTVTVHAGAGRANMLNWYTDTSAWGPDHDDEIVAHEAGHMMGVYDEYAEPFVDQNNNLRYDSGEPFTDAYNPPNGRWDCGALDPNTWLMHTGSLMDSLGPTRNWHYEEILQWLEGKSGRDLTLAQSPLPPYPYSDPVVNFVDPFDSTSPTTILKIGDPKYTDPSSNVFVTSDTPFTLTAEDNVDGSGVATTGYRIRNAIDSGWTTSVPPIEFYLASLVDGSYFIDYNSTDNAGNIETMQTVSVTLDNSRPLIMVENPPAGWALQDGVTFIASASDSSGTCDLSFSIREANGDQGIPVGFEDIPATYDAITGRWNWYFNTLQLPDGYYIVLVNAEDNLGHEGSTMVSYSIRNWAVLELLPASESNKAGRTMPVKFALRVAASVDPSQPFVYNEDLTIKIYATNNPSKILQTSTYGETARDYRISTASEKYHTNFQTLKTPMQYTVSIWRGNFLVGSFTFKTVK